MTDMRLLAVFFVLAAAQPAAADLRGHGGPVRALEIAPDGERAISGGFDNSVSRWSLGSSAARDVIRFHDGPVNAVALLADGLSASAGEDGRIAIWGESPTRPVRVLAGHEAKVVALAASPDGRSIASASWDRTVRVWSVATGESRIVARHQDNVNGVAFSADGSTVISAGYDAHLRLAPVAGGEAAAVGFPAPLNAVRVAPDGEIVVAAADGVLHILGADGRARRTVEGLPTPLVALAVSPDGTLIAAAGLRGAVAVVERATLRRVVDLVGPRFPVWSLAFAPDGATLYTGGADRTIRRWDPRTGASQNPVVSVVDRESELMASGERGALVFRACVACHTLTPDAGNRAGPTLHGVMGRRIGVAPGYAFSEALTRMDIVWTPDAIARLFEIGPNAMTPGTKMPEQIIGDPDDRRALVEWLDRVTR
jgi:cytochrome c